MKKVALLTLILVVGILFKAYAEDAKLVEVNNKMCPISHEEVGSASGGLCLGPAGHLALQFETCGGQQRLAL